MARQLLSSESTWWASSGSAARAADQAGGEQAHATDSGLPGLQCLSGGGRCRQSAAWGCAACPYRLETLVDDLVNVNNLLGLAGLEVVEDVPVGKPARGDKRGLGGRLLTGIVQQQHTCILKLSVSLHSLVVDEGLAHAVKGCLGPARALQVATGDLACRSHSAVQHRCPYCRFPGARPPPPHLERLGARALGLVGLQDLQKAKSNAVQQARLRHVPQQCRPLPARPPRGRPAEPAAGACCPPPAPAAALTCTVLYTPHSWKRVFFRPNRLGALQQERLQLVLAAGDGREGADEVSAGSRASCSAP